MRNSITILRQCGIQPTPQRIAVVDFVFESKAHPSADTILDNVRKACPTISRATVYNTLNLLVEKGLLRTQILKEGTIIFDPNISRHHHFVDEESGKVYDIPWEALKVTENKSLKEFEIRDYQVVMRGRKKNR
jgi:Fur family transcriptional regulator, iron response regulator